MPVSFFLPPVKNKCYTANKADAWLPNGKVVGFAVLFLKPPECGSLWLVLVRAHVCMSVCLWAVSQAGKTSIIVSSAQCAGAFICLWPFGDFCQGFSFYDVVQKTLLCWYFAMQSALPTQTYHPIPTTSACGAYGILHVDILCSVNIPCPGQRSWWGQSPSPARRPCGSWLHWLWVERWPAQTG